MNQDRNSMIVLSNMTTTNELILNKTVSSDLKKIKKNSKRGSSKPGGKSQRNSITNLEGDKQSNMISKRSDIYGNPIIKGSKAYTVTFVDQTSKRPFEQIIRVTSYKKFYNDNDEGDSVKSRDAHCGCGCIVM
jgi:hypothetical protein